MKQQVLSRKQVEEVGVCPCAAGVPFLGERNSPATKAGDGGHVVRKGRENSGICSYDGQGFPWLGGLGWAGGLQGTEGEGERSPEQCGNEDEGYSLRLQAAFWPEAEYGGWDSVVLVFQGSRSSHPG